MEALLQRLKAVVRDTDPDEPHGRSIPDGESVGEFVLTKRAVNLAIRQIRSAIHARNLYAEAPETKDDSPEIVRQSNSIRDDLESVRRQAQQLRRILDLEERENRDGSASESVAACQTMCDLVDAHIGECDRWSKGIAFVSVRDDPTKQALLKGAQQRRRTISASFVPSNPTESELEDIDGIDEWRLQIRERTESQIAERIGQNETEIGLLVGQPDVSLERPCASSRYWCLDILLVLMITGLVSYLLWKYT
jgi:hypothetical protein